LISLQYFFNLNQSFKFDLAEVFLATDFIDFFSSNFVIF